MATKLVALLLYRGGRDDPAIAQAEAGEEWRIRLLEMEDDGAWIGRLDGLERTEQRLARGSQLGIKEAAERELDRRGVERCAVAELKAAAEDECQRLAAIVDRP